MMRISCLELWLSREEIAALDLLADSEFRGCTCTEAAQRILELELERRCRETDLGKAVRARLYGKGSA